MNRLAQKLDNTKKCFEDPVIVVGTGPVGIKFIRSFLEQNDDGDVIIFGNEPWEPYNRVKLSSFFAGQLNWDELVKSQKLPQDSRISVHFNCAIKNIDTEYKKVTDDDGNNYFYSKLILATGSSPHIPNIPGIDLDNIFTFRDMSDVEGLLARRTRSRKTVVIGGGVLGIEAAKAMARLNTEVSIIDHSTGLMSSQLDEAASEILHEYILSEGIKVYLDQAVKQFDGDKKVEEIQLRDGRTISCDTVILTTGIKPNIDLARNARLSVGRGIRVNDAMQTSDKHVYAVGECAEHRGKVYGVVKPGYEQAKVAAYHLAGKRANYSGSLAGTQIKVIDKSVFSIGNIDDVSAVGLEKEYIYRGDNNLYRRIICKSHRIVGAISVGPWSELGRVQEFVLNKRFVSPFALKRFKNTGKLWPEEDSGNIAQWPASTVVCNCTGVTRGQLTQALNSGCTSIPQLSEKTGASSVCGSCRPLLSQMLSGSPAAEPAAGSGKLFVFGLLTLAVCLMALLLPRIPYSDTVQVMWQWDSLWRENLFKQISGYTLVVLTIIVLFLSLRRRTKYFSILSFPVWRIIHVIVGFLTVVGLAVHSGFYLGNGLNLYLAGSFVAVLLAGAISSIFVANEHKLDVSLAGKIKNKLVWVHVLTFWPLPALLAAHILKSYYF